MKRQVVVSHVWRSDTLHSPKKSVTPPFIILKERLRIKLNEVDQRKADQVVERFISFNQAINEESRKAIRNIQFQKTQ